MQRCELGAAGTRCIDSIFKNEQLAHEPNAEGGAIELPGDMIDRLRVDLAVWKAREPAQG